MAKESIPQSRIKLGQKLVIDVEKLDKKIEETKEKLKELKAQREVASGAVFEFASTLAQYELEFPKEKVD